VSDPTAYTRAEIMTVTAARQLADGMVCFVGIGLPSEAANLARLTHAPECVLVYESGTLGSKPDVLPLSIGDGDLAATADAVVSGSEVFAYWLQSGRIDVGFLTAAQIDRYGNLNTTVIGPYGEPAVRLPGAGGAPEIASGAQRVFVTMRHQPRAFVEHLDFVTTVGHGPNGEGREALGLRGRGPTILITDLAVLEPDPETHEFVLVSVHPGVTLHEVTAATGWELRIAPSPGETDPPTPHELEVLRDLKRRTATAHAG
jgi:glutaconate CoA-transferase subunit B